MEWWSAAEMLGILNTPILQHSTTPIRKEFTHVLHAYR